MIMLRFTFFLAAAVTTTSALSIINHPRPFIANKVNGETPKAPYMPVELLPPPENLPASSTRRLSRIEMQKAITDVKRFIEARLESDLHLIRVRKNVETPLGIPVSLIKNAHRFFPSLISNST